jgi:hypothetical protein
MDVERIRQKYGWNALVCDRVVRRPTTRLRALAVERLALRRGVTALDFGCGTGLSFELLERVVGRGDPRDRRPIRASVRPRPRKAPARRSFRAGLRGRGTVLVAFVGVFAVVSVLVGRFGFGDQMPVATWVGLLVVLSGSLIIHFGGC